MAKGNFALGKFRGKVGGQVLRVDAGVGQIISEYNPNPRNPRTLSQTLQRGKMNLAGQISKMLPKFALVGLSTRGRDARSKFVSDLLKNMTAPAAITPGTPAEYKVACNALTFCEGPNIGLPASVVVGENSLTVRMADSEGTANLIGGIAILVGTDENDNVFAMAATMTKNGNNIEAEFGNTLGGTGFAYGYVVPFVSVDEGLIAQYGQIISSSTGGADNMLASVLVSLAQSGAFRHSVVSERASN